MAVARYRSRSGIGQCRRDGIDANMERSVFGCEIACERLQRGVRRLRRSRGALGGKVHDDAAAVHHQCTRMLRTPQGALKVRVDCLLQARFGDLADRRARLIGNVVDENVEVAMARFDLREHACDVVALCCRCAHELGAAASRRDLFVGALRIRRRTEIVENDSGATRRELECDRLPCAVRSVDNHRELAVEILH